MVFIKRTLKKIYDITSTILIILVAILTALLVGVRLFGLTPYTVLSGSMEPTYHVGSIIYVTNTNGNDLKVDDPVTYYIEGGTVVTHRIIEIFPDENNVGKRLFRTQGDANNIPDGALLREENIIGKPVFTIPLLGYVSNFVQNPKGAIVAVGGCVILVIISLMSDIIFSSGKKNNDDSVQP